MMGEQAMELQDRTKILQKRVIELEQKVTRLSKLKNFIEFNF